MMLGAGIVCLSIWVYLLAAHGHFWRISKFIPQASTFPEFHGRVAVIIPARDEADVVAQAVASVLGQKQVRELHVFLVDDSSTDGTAEIAKRAADEAGQSGALTIIHGQPLPAGWSGKLWAVKQGIDAALALNPDFVLLTDADIVHGPESVAALVSIAETGGYDLVSFMAKLFCRSFAERMLIPAFVYFFFQLYPPAWIRDRRKATAGAAGGCILIRPEALVRAGGIAAIRGEIIDDCALARRVKRSGGRVWLGTTAAMQSIRPYGSFAEIGRMISRSAFNQLRHSTLLLLLAIAGMVVIYLLPPALAIFSVHWIPGALGGAAWVLMAASFIPVLRFYGLNPLWSVALPLIALFYMGATLHSALKFWLGQGGEWKGRVQDPGTAEGQHSGN